MLSWVAQEPNAKMQTVTKNHVMETRVVRQNFVQLMARLWVSPTSERKPVRCLVVPQLLRMACSRRKPRIAGFTGNL